jgi:MarR family transcriptional regulator, organic hydroperoxide resistance regulator
VRVSEVNLTRFLLRQSHPMVIKWIKRLRQQGLAKVSKDANDARRSMLSLTPKGRAVVKRLREILVTIEQAMTELADEAMPGLVPGLWAMERQLRATPFLERLRARASRENDSPR